MSKLSSLNERAINYMRSMCPHCHHKIGCREYMDESYWKYIFSRPDERMEPRCDTCSRFEHMSMPKRPNHQS
jgi:hypothetical protein